MSESATNLYDATRVKSKSVIKNILKRCEIGQLDAVNQQLIVQETTKL